MTLQEIQNIPADDKGMIILELNGAERRFLKEKFISYLQRNQVTPGFEIPKLKIRRERKLKKETKKYKKRVKKEKVVKVVKPGGRGFCNSVPIIAVLPDGTELPFPSSAKASRALNIYKCGIHRVLYNKLPHVNNIRFKFQTAS